MENLMFENSPPAALPGAKLLKSLINRSFLLKKERMAVLIDLTMFSFYLTIQRVISVPW